LFTFIVSDKSYLDMKVILFWKVLCISKLIDNCDM
jgi:hypothetical protein